MRNYKYINEWLSQRNIRLAAGFAETLRSYAAKYKKSNKMNLSEIYSILGCSKQNVSYWELHCDSTQAAGSIRRVVCSAAELFGLSEPETEHLANSAGLSLCGEGGNLLEILGYSGGICSLGNSAMISERMLRHYKKNPYKASVDGNRYRAGNAR